MAACIENYELKNIIDPKALVKLNINIRLITFSINDTTMLAKHGMIWTSGFIVTRGEAKTCKSTNCKLITSIIRTYYIPLIGTHKTTQFLTWIVTFVDAIVATTIIFGFPAHLIAGSITSSLSFVSQTLRPIKTSNYSILKMDLHTYD